LIPFADGAPNPFLLTASLAVVNSLLVKDWITVSVAHCCMTKRPHEGNKCRFYAIELTGESASCRACAWRCSRLPVASGVRLWVGLLMFKALNGLPQRYLKGCLSPL